VTEKVRRFVSRGGDKLEAALLHFDIKVGGLVCLDVGASTGGFTDCLLKRGAKKVYAVDVGYGQLDWNLRNDPKVVVMERINVRYLNPALLQDRIDLVTIDVAFISLTKVLPKIREIISPSPRRGEVPDEGQRGEEGRQGFEWNRWIKSLQVKRPQIAALLEHGILLKAGDGGVEIGFAKGSIHLQMLQSADKVALLSDLIAQEVGRKMEVRLVESEAVSVKPPRSSLESPEVLGAIEVLGAKVREVRSKL